MMGCDGMMLLSKINAMFSSVLYLFHLFLARKDDKASGLLILTSLNSSEQKWYLYNVYITYIIIPTIYV